MTILELRIDRRGHGVSGHPDPDIVTVIHSTGLEDLGFPDLPPHTVNANSSCSKCDMWLSYEPDFSDGILRPTKPCPYPDGFTTVTTIGFWSGKVVVDDSLRDAYPMIDDDLGYMASYNSAIGQMQYVMQSAQQGLAYGPVLNTCPSIYVHDEHADKFIVVSPGYDEANEVDSVPIPNYSKRVAWVCTDLWAYSMADYVEFLRRGGDPIEEEDQNGTRSVIDVPKGLYKFTLHTGEAEFWIKADEDPTKPTIYAEFERLP